MLSGKLPTGTVGAGDATGPRRSDRDAATRRTDERERTEPANDGTWSGARTAPAATAEARRGTRTAPAPATAATAGGERQGARTTRADRTPGGTTGAPDRGGEGGRSDLERRLAGERAERRAVIDRYERVLAERTAASEADGARGAAGAGDGIGDVGRVRAWVRRACCRVRLRLSRRG